MNSSNKMIKTFFVSFLVVTFAGVANLATGMFPLTQSANAIDVDLTDFKCFGMFNNCDNNIDNSITDNSVDNSDNSVNDSYNDNSDNSQDNDVTISDSYNSSQNCGNNTADGTVSNSTVTCSIEPPSTLGLT